MPTIWEDAESEGAHPPPLTFAELTRAAARQAQKSVEGTTSALRSRRVYDEDDITGFFAGRLEADLQQLSGFGVDVTAAVFRHRRGVAAEEKRSGADLLIHVTMNTPQQAFSKGVLIQAKKNDVGRYFGPSEHNRVVAQCNRMLSITAASFVFNYTQRGIRCGAATRVAGAQVPSNLDELCGWTAYRFFLEFFRCPIGDRRITKESVDDLNVPYALGVEFSGNLASEGGLF